MRCGLGRHELGSIGLVWSRSRWLAATVTTVATVASGSLTLLGRFESPLESLLRLFDGVAQAVELGRDVRSHWAQSLSTQVVELEQFLCVRHQLRDFRPALFFEVESIRTCRELTAKQDPVDPAFEVERPRIDLLEFRLPLLDEAAQPITSLARSRCVVATQENAQVFLVTLDQRTKLARLEMELPSLWRDIAGIIARRDAP